MLSLFKGLQAAILAVAEYNTLWWNEQLMLWLIGMVDEEQAPGAAYNVRFEGGGTLLTNPAAMIR